MPKVNKLYPIKVLLEMLKNTSLPSRRRVTFEYVLLAGVNDSIADAVRLVRLSHGIKCKINLIPFNEFKESRYRRPSNDQIEKFQKTLLKGGLVATLRKNRGEDILAACGQLSGEAQPAAIIADPLGRLGLIKEQALPVRARGVGALRSEQAPTSNC